MGKVIYYEPDFVLRSKIFGDELKITVGGRDVLFEAIVDRCGNQWTLNKKELIKKIKNDK